jgi:hypothetical protein
MEPAEAAIERNRSQLTGAPISPRNFIENAI